jgi:hypothetical protein
MINAGGPGDGQSVLTLLLFTPGDRIVAPQHSECKRLQKEAKFC